MMKDFTILPAIDLKGGRCVRLRQGQADRETVYGGDPVAMARSWHEQGAEYLHVVDLDGAFSGQPAHLDAVLAIVGAVPIPVEVGGGIRTTGQIRTYLEGGVNRVILGTRACVDTQSMTALAGEFGPALAVGIDARNGLVQVRGWTHTTSLEGVELARRMNEAGVRTLIYTDTACDGMLSGVNAAAIDAVCAAVTCDVIASGGVSSAADVRRLKDLARPNLRGVIVGKALYDRNVTLAELRAAT